jgi:hypothetical protein
MKSFNFFHRGFFHRKNGKIPSSSSRALPFGNTIAKRMADLLNVEFPETRRQRLTHEEAKLVGKAGRLKVAIAPDETGGIACEEPTDGGV